MTTPAQVCETYRDALSGNLAAIIQWDTWKLEERLRNPSPTPRARRSIRYYQRKIASMKRELARA